MSLQAVGPVDGHDPVVRGRRQIHPGAVHRRQVILQAGLVPRPNMEHPLPVDLPQAQRQNIHTRHSHDWAATMLE